MAISKNSTEKSFEDETFMEISPADFFYRNRDLAGFNNPTRAIYSAIRELLENSLDACELYGIPPKILFRLSFEGGEKGEPSESTYLLKIMDNGSGIPQEYIPSAFGQILFGSKYKLRQVRGTFGLGGKMAILYGQITTNGTARILSSIGKREIYEFNLRIDIQSNKPEILGRRVQENKNHWHGTIVEFALDGDYPRAMPKILEYLQQTAMVNPYAEIVFIDPRGRLYRFESVTSKMPEPPKEVLPHPYGCDVETIRRIINVTTCHNMLCFMSKHFHRVGRKTAQSFLDYAGIDSALNPEKLNSDEIVRIVQMMKSYTGFLPPDASCLSPLGTELLEAGIMKELEPEFVYIEQRDPSAYSGFPFIIEVGVAYGGNTASNSNFTLYRFANKIPLLYDEASDISRRILNEKKDWKRYKIRPDMPIAFFVHVCSTKVPYKTVGKEYIADRPELEKEIRNGVNSVSRRLSRFLSRQISIEHERRRLTLFKRYLPKIAQFSTDLSPGKRKVPDVNPLLDSLRRYQEESA
jgi:DNA topoisomerase-6 subunit B